MIKNTVIKANQEKLAQKKIRQLLANNPIPTQSLLEHLHVFLTRQSMSRIIYIYELYQKILNIHGAIFEFGVRWGGNMVLYELFRSMLEPFNYNRKIIGFDTFSGFPSVSEKDLEHEVGEMATTENYDVFLDQLLMAVEENAPLSHLKKYQLVKGDAVQRLKLYLEEHPETIISMAYFDFDIYEPTKVCLELCKEHFVKGSVIAFDELNHPDWPGETVALKEIFNINTIRLQRLPYNPTTSFFILE